MNNKSSRLSYLTRGIILENPTLILMIGLCPTLATSITAKDGLGMGAAASFVIIGSNLVVSLLRKLIPTSIRIPIFIIIISTFVTIIDYVLQAYQPALYRVLGVFVPLIVVNCIVLGRVEAFAYKHGVFDSFLDGLGKSLGFTLVLGVMGIIREFFGAGTLFGKIATPVWFRQYPMLLMLFPPGAFLLIGIFKALINKFMKQESL
ncbi:MAG: electron transport complex subunit RsxE [candidate division WOR-3 bacterium]|nr:electron transport complex subunit RsxE [candidate division WOR-3 bacterium]MDH5684410.1 electron transport complex subunit RsxE [candidate division WOR-3 bacterium]